MSKYADGQDPDQSWHAADYVPKRTWKCWLGFHRWVATGRHSKPGFRFYDDMMCWRCHKKKVVRVWISDLWAK